MRPFGADNFLKWRRSIDEHLELRRLTWDEYAMFNWLCTEANPRTGTLRTSWPTLAEQTGLSPAHVEKLCRSLKRKRYLWYPNHRGQRGRLVEVGIHKYPVAGDSYTDLSARFEEVPSEVGGETPADPGASPARRRRKRQRPLRVCSADAGEEGTTLTRAEALGRAPAALRETLELYCFKTGRESIDAADLECLGPLDGAHTPAVIQKAITRAVERLESDPEMFESKVLTQVDGNPYALVEMVKQVAGEPVVGPQAIRDLYHAAGVRYLDITPALLLVGAGIVAARFVALGLDDPRPLHHRRHSRRHLRRGALLPLPRPLPARMRPG